MGTIRVPSRVCVHQRDSLFSVGSFNSQSGPFCRRTSSDSFAKQRSNSLPGLPGVQSRRKPPKTGSWLKAVLCCSWWIRTWGWINKRWVASYTAFDTTVQSRQVQRQHGARSSLSQAGMALSSWALLCYVLFGRLELLCFHIHWSSKSASCTTVWEHRTTQVVKVGPGIWCQQIGVIGTCERCTMS